MRDFWREPKHLQKRLGRVCCIAFGGARREGNFPTKFDDTTEDTGDNAYEGGGSEAAAYRIVTILKDTLIFSFAKLRAFMMSPITCAL